MQPRKLRLEAKPFTITKSPEKVQPAPTAKKTAKKSPPKAKEPLLEFDPKYGYWIYPHDEYLRRVRLQKEQTKAVQEQEKQRETLRLRKRAKLRQRREGGLARIGKIMFELKQSRGQQLRTEKAKQFKFAVDDEGEVQIVEKAKKHRISKIKKAKLQFEEEYEGSIQKVLDDNDEYETIAEESETEIKVIPNSKPPAMTPQQLASTLQALDSNPLCSTPYKLMTVRGWVNHLLSPQLDDMVLRLVNNLALMQARKKVLEPKKFKKRIVAGFNEVTRTLTSSIAEKLSRMVLMPINIIQNPLPNGSDEKILNILRLCHQRNIPVVHASNKTRYGRAFCGKYGAKLSAISIINYQGQDDLFKEVLALQSSLKEEYANLGYQDLVLQQVIIKS